MIKISSNIFNDFQEIDDKKIIYDYLNKTIERTNGTILSDWDVPSLIFYKEIPKFRYKIIDNFLLLLGKVFLKEGFYFYLPFGDYQDEIFLNLIKKIFETYKVDTLNFAFVPYSFLRYFLLLKKSYKVNISFLRSESDYIYSIKDFDCIKQKRVRNLVREYSPTFEVIDDDNKELCLKIHKKYWCSNQKCKGECTYCSLNYVENIIKNFEELNFHGIVVKNRDGLMGFIIFKKIFSSIICYEIKYTHIIGLNYYIFQSMLDSLKTDKCIKWINFTADDNIKNLRRYKKHFCKKYKLLHKYYVKITKIV